ncbi:MAG: response regulator [Deltaproteobacteria bacterium]|nr:response regulator [Deltaproteobacteria bacterium]
MFTRDAKNILVADDSEFFRVRLSDILTEAGHNVKIARGGEEAIKGIGTNPEGVDLLILDLQMPHVDGFGVLEWIRRNGLLGKFPILAITGVYEPTHVLQRLKDLGATGMMTKALTPEQIIFRVNNLLFPEKITARAKPRAPITVPVDFTVGDSTSTGYLLNISETGMFLHTRKTLLPGAITSLRFTLPGSERILNIKGVVKWSSQSHEERGLFSGVGIEFMSLDLEAQRLISEFVEKEDKKLGLEE